jgi:hypothetical protein
VVYVPDELDAAVVGLGPYNVRTTLRGKPGGRKITLGVWDFTPKHEAEPVRRYLVESGPTIADDLALLAKTDWLAGPVPATRLTPSRVEKLAKAAQTRRRPTPFDEMTDTVVTPHVAWAKPLPGGPVRLLVIAPRWEQRETVELAQRLDVECQTVSVSAPDSLLNPGSLYLYGSYDIYGYPRKNESDVLFEMADKLRAANDCVILSGFQPELMPGHVRSELAEKVRGGAGLILLGAAKGFLAELKDQLEPADWTADVVPTAKLPVLDRMVAENRPIASAYQCGKGAASASCCCTSGASRTELPSTTARPASTPAHSPDGTTRVPSWVSPAWSRTWAFNSTCSLMSRSSRANSASTRLCSCPPRRRLARTFSAAGGRICL